MNLRLIGPDDERPFEYPKASMWLRCGARLFDVLVAWLLYRATGPAGVVMALLYILFADAMIAGQSLGKKVFGVRAIFTPTRTFVRHRDSVLRNAPFGLVIILSMMPDLGLHAFAAGVFVIGGIEAWTAFRDPCGKRLGDLWAQTQVIDGKDMVSQAEVVQRQTQAARAFGSGQEKRATQCTSLIR